MPLLGFRAVPPDLLKKETVVHAHTHTHRACKCTRNQLQLHRDNMGGNDRGGDVVQNEEGGEPTQIPKTEQIHFPTFQKKIGKLKLHCVDKP